MTAKEYLSQAYYVDKRIQSKLIQVESLRDLANKVTPTSGTEHVSGSRSVHRMDLKYTCRRCRGIKAVVKKVRSNIISTEKKDKKLEIAIKRISKVASITNYEKAYAVVKKYINRDGWFQSTEEIMTALELVRRKIKVRHQVQISKYSADFLLPDLKVVLEIDGKPFHGVERAEKEKKRDEFTVQQLGEGWEVIRIDTEYINTNVTRLVPAIKAILESRRKLKILKSHARVH